MIPAATMLPVHDHGSDFDHDPRCSGECEYCHGADACGLVGHGCEPCHGCNAYRRWEASFRLTTTDDYTEVF